MVVTITITLAGPGTGPFDLYSDSDGFLVPFETGVSKAALEAGYTSNLVPNDATLIKIVSVGVCTDYITISIALANATTTTTSTTATPTTSTTTTNPFTPTTTTTTTIAPGISCYTIDVTSGYTTGCAYAPAQYYSDPTETYTITLRDSMGNPITTPTNLYFGISWTSTEVQETGTIITPNSTTFFVPAGTSSTFQLFTINQTVNCDYSGACNGSCYNAISDITITPPEGLSLCIS
jgi:hypothetical protein